MADIATSPVDAGVLQTWDSTRNLRPSYPAVPVGQIAFNDSQAIAAVGAGDTSTFTLTLTLPRNYVYLVTWVNVTTQSLAATVLYGRAMAMITRPSPLPPSGGLDNVQLYNMAGAMTTGTTGQVITAVPATQTNYLGAFGILPTSLIPCLNADGAITITWHSLEGVEPAVTVLWNIRVLRYTIEQWRTGSIHTPTPVMAAP